MLAGADAAAAAAAGSLRGTLGLVAAVGAESALPARCMFGAAAVLTASEFVGGADGADNRPESHTAAAEADVPTSDRTIPGPAAGAALIGGPLESALSGGGNEPETTSAALALIPLAWDCRRPAPLRAWSSSERKAACDFPCDC